MSKSGTPMVMLAQLALSGSALSQFIWTGTLWPGVVALGFVAGAAIAVTLRRKSPGWLQILAWVCTAIAWLTLAVHRDRDYLLDDYFAVLAWLMAASILLASGRLVDGAARTQWKVFGMAWALLGGGLWLASSYVLNRSGHFYAGVVIAVGLLVVCKTWFRPSPFGIQAVNTLMLLLIGLPVCDLITRPRYPTEAHPDLSRRPYSYAATRKDPEAFARWWNYYRGQWLVGLGDVLIPDPAHIFPLRLRPNSHGWFFNNPVSINSRGFRGREISAQKGDTYRIVALGESTTFDVGLNAGEKPWPEMLEQMIRERLKPSRPVEVINAGIPSCNLQQNLRRLAPDILPLKPDMIISYHGYNGFGLLRPVTRSLRAETPPAYRERPVKLLADCEFRLRMILHLHRRSAHFADAPQFAGAMDTDYAKAYQSLIQAAQTNRIRLVLANYSMAVNAQSDPGVIAFYRAGFPEVYWRIRANAVHSWIVGQLAAQHPEICFVDTHPGLDGDHEKFVDVMHFAEEGRRQLAETMFAGITNVLRQDLAGTVK